LRAVELQPSYDEAAFNAASLLASLGSLDESLRWHKRVVLLRPQPPHFAATAYAIRLLELGFEREGREWIERAHAFDPLCPALAECLAREALVQGDAEAARAALAPALRPGHATPHVQELAGWIELLRGDFGRASERFAWAASADARAPDSWPQLGLAVCARARGEPGACAKIALDAIPEIEAAIASGDERPEQPRQLAVAHALRGSSTDALAWLERAFEAGWRDHRWDAIDPAFDGIRSSAGFVALAARTRESVAAMRQRAERLAWNRPEVEEPRAA
jgi:tetratricopeptide (TPR) repeat protein